MRSEQLTQFIADAGWADAQRALLAGDASNRRYERLTKLNNRRETAVLMDAPPEKGEDIRPFTRIARHLLGLGLSAPKIFAEDPELGALLIEDLGDDLFARVLTRHLDQEMPLYIAATDALFAAQNATPPPSLARYDASTMAQTAELICQWYLPAMGGDPSSAASLNALLTPHLDTLHETPPVLVQRDYHAENLIWLPDRNGTAKVGLLDFQDAMLGHPAYDLASLLRDARRDVSLEVHDVVLEHFISLSGYPDGAFRRAYAICSLQRNLRIMGVFARLCLRDGKAQYPPLLPRVWDNLQRDLAHPALSDMATWVAETVPVPTPDHVAKLISLSRAKHV